MAHGGADNTPWNTHQRQLCLMEIYRQFFGSSFSNVNFIQTEGSERAKVWRRLWMVWCGGNGVGVIGGGGGLWRAWAQHMTETQKCSKRRSWLQVRSWLPKIYGEVHEDVCKKWKPLAERPKGTPGHKRKCSPCRAMPTRTVGDGFRVGMGICKYHR